MSSGVKRAVFLDRDGTLIHDVDYPRDPEGVRLLDGAAAALARLGELGFALVVVSNQSGVGRGRITADEARRVHERMTADLAAHGVALDAAYYCFHGPEDGCVCRKPAPGMLLQAARVGPRCRAVVHDWRQGQRHGGRPAGGVPDDLPGGHLRAAGRGRGRRTPRRRPGPTWCGPWKR